MKYTAARHYPPNQQCSQETGYMPTLYMTQLLKNRCLNIMPVIPEKQISILGLGAFISVLNRGITCISCLFPRVKGGLTWRLSFVSYSHWHSCEVDRLRGKGCMKVTSWASTVSPNPGFSLVPCTRAPA